MLFPILTVSLLAMAQAVYPDNECCDLANDPVGCRAYTQHASDDFDNCVGGIGVDCEGVQYDLDFGVAGEITIDLVTPINNGDGTVTLKTSVGSILHDLCCIQHPNGAFCTASNYPIDETINLSGSADNSCACIMEWRKAAWNTIRDRTWEQTFSSAAGSSDLEPRPDVERKSYLPTSWTTNYLPNKSTWDLVEVQATAQLCAPVGTRLDCPSEDDNCKVPCFGTSCKACAHGCSSRHRRRWNDDGRDHANAGDSDYCCSGEFKEVYWQLDGTRYGTCA